jgi:hypothetical protein
VRTIAAKLRSAWALVFGACLAVLAGAAGAQSAFVKVGLETAYDAGERCGVPH